MDEHLEVIERLARWVQEYGRDVELNWVRQAAIEADAALLLKAADNWRRDLETLGGERRAGPPGGPPCMDQPPPYRTSGVLVCPECEAEAPASEGKAPIHKLGCSWNQPPPKVALPGEIRQPTEAEAAAHEWLARERRHSR